MMTNYISQETILNQLKRKPAYEFNTYNRVVRMYDIEDVQSAIEEALNEISIALGGVTGDSNTTPSGLVAPPQTNVWLENINDNWFEYSVQCSFCRLLAHDKTAYCPNCGAKMKG